MRASKVFIVVAISVLISHFSLMAYGSISTNERTVFPYLTDILDAYCVYYITGPNDLKELEEFADDIQEKFPDEYSYCSILKIKTFPILKQDIDNLQFMNDTCSFTLKIRNFVLYSSEVLPCCYETNVPYPEERLPLIAKKIRYSMYAFDQTGKSLFSPHQLQKRIWEEMRKVYSMYNVDKQNAILLEFNMDKGLSSYCKKDMINCNSAYLEKIRCILESICEEYKVRRLIFYVYKSL